MPVRIDWNRQPVSIHSDDRQELEVTNSISQNKAFNTQTLNYYAGP